MQRANPVPRPDRLIGRLSGKPRLLGIDFDKGVQFSISRLDPRQRGVDEVCLLYTSDAADE